MIRAANRSAWAVGYPAHNGFHVRRVVWGLLMAVAERREGEQIRKCELLVEPYTKRRSLPKLFD